jgi:hypothetical protein
MFEIFYVLFYAKLLTFENLEKLDLSGLEKLDNPK